MRGEDPRITKARAFLFAVELDKRREAKRQEMAAVCGCGHARKFHSTSASINYTGGFCSKCECRNFLQRVELTEARRAQKKGK